MFSNVSLLLKFLQSVKDYNVLTIPIHTHFSIRLASLASLSSLSYLVFFDDHCIIMFNIFYIYVDTYIYIRYIYI